MSTTTVRDLKAKLVKVQALFARTTHAGERNAASEAINRILEQLKQHGDSAQQSSSYTSKQWFYSEPAVEMRCTIAAGWSHAVFKAVCSKHGIKPYRRSGQRNTTFMVKAQRSIIDQMWKEYRHLNKQITAHIDQEVARLIRTMM